MRFYLDTSVFGGFWDEEFRRDTVKFFDYIKQKEIEIIYSGIIEDELSDAPYRVSSLLEKLPNT